MKLFIVLIMTFVSFHAHSQASMPLIVQTSECGAAAMVLGRAMKLTDSQVQYEIFIRQAVAWGKTSYQLGSSLGLPDAKLKLLNQQSSKNIIDPTIGSIDLDSSLKLINEKYKSCINLAKSDSKIREIFSLYY